MIITDNTVVNDTLAAILVKESMIISLDQRDVNRLFGENPSLRLLKVAGNSIDEVVPAVKEDLAAIGGCPAKLLSAYISMSLRMNDLAVLNDLFSEVERRKHTIIFEDDPAGAIALYYFFE